MPNIRPYLCIPYLKEQTTWGGNYIVKFKGWENVNELQNKKIGQSYELYGATKLSRSLNSSKDPSFSFEQEENCEDYLALSDLVSENPSLILGSKVYQKYGPHFPILIKFTQAQGNSFQLHPHVKTDKWNLKPETWYYLENGLATYGIKENCNLTGFHGLCLEIDAFMQNLSLKVQKGEITIESARQQAQDQIAKNSPIKFVNLCHIEKGSLLDLSMGAIHHSWEEDTANYPLGNIVYEIQLDKKDEDTTIRAFDQGKIKDDGNVRSLNIDDYFQFLNSDPEINDYHNAQQKPKSVYKNKRNEVEILLQNEFYTLEKITVSGKIPSSLCLLNNSFHHLFLIAGEIEIITENGNLILTQGHSAFLPASLKTYEIQNKFNSESIILRSSC